MQVIRLSMTFYCFAIYIFWVCHWIVHSIKSQCDCMVSSDNPEGRHWRRKTIEHPCVALLDLWGCRWEMRKIWVSYSLWDWVFESKLLEIVVVNVVRSACTHTHAHLSAHWNGPKNFIVVFVVVVVGGTRFIDTFQIQSKTFSIFFPVDFRSVIFHLHTNQVSKSLT